LRQGEASFLLFVFLTPSVCHVIANFIIHNALRACSIHSKSNRNNASKRLFWEPFSFWNTWIAIPAIRPPEQNSWKIFRNIFLFQNIPNVWVINLMIAQHLTE